MSIRSILAGTLTVLTLAALMALPVSARQSGGDGPVTELAQLEGKRVGILTGSVFDAMLAQRFPTAEAAYYNNFTDQVAALQSGRIDAFLLDEPAARDIMRTAQGIGFLPEFLSGAEYAFAFPQGSEALRDEVNGVLAAMEADGTLAAVDAAWFGEDEEAKVLPVLELTGEQGTLRFATSSTQPPFSYVKDGRVVGYDIDVMMRVCAELGYGLEVSDMNFDAIIPGLLTGKYDLAGACITVTEERAKSVLFSRADYTGGVVAMVRTGQADPPGFWAGLKERFKGTFLTENRWRMFAAGLGVTLLISLASAAFGTALGFAVCLLCRSRHPWASIPARVFVRVVQGVPVLVILMLLCYLIFTDPGVNEILIAVTGFSINFAAYVSEMLRTGIDGVDPGQLEAAYALGYSRVQTFCKITLPQAVRRVLPVYQGELVSMVKMTSVVGYIAIQDLTKMSDIVRSRTYDAFFSLLTTAAIYFLLTALMVLLLSRLQSKMDPKRRRRVVKGVEA